MVYILACQTFQVPFRYSSFVTILEYVEISLGVSEFLIQMRRHQDLSLSIFLIEISWFRASCIYH